MSNNKFLSGNVIVDVENVFKLSRIFIDDEKNLFSTNISRNHSAKLNQFDSFEVKLSNNKTLKKCKFEKVIEQISKNNFRLLYTYEKIE